MLESIVPGIEALAFQVSVCSVPRFTGKQGLGYQSVAICSRCLSFKSWPVLSIYKEKAEGQKTDAELRCVVTASHLPCSVPSSCLLCECLSTSQFCFSCIFTF